MSREIRTPMTTIVGFSHVLPENLRGEAKTTHRPIPVGYCFPAPLDLNPGAPGSTVGVATSCRHQGPASVSVTN